MIVPTIVVYLVLLGLLAFAAYTLFIAVPCDVCSMTRYRLWRIRDEMYDGIRSGEFADTPNHRLMLESAELGIRLAPHITPLRLAVFVATPWLFNVDAPEVDDPVAQDPLPSGKVVDPRNRAFIRVMTIHFFFGSPSGWLLTLVLCLTIAPAVFLWGMYRELLRGDTKTQSAVLAVWQQAQRAVAAEHAGSIEADSSLAGCI